MAKVFVGTMVAMLIAPYQRPGVSSPGDCDAKPVTRVWSAITPAVVKERVEPSWPNPQFNGIHGTTILDVWIQERGNVSCIKIVRSIPINDQAAIEAVRQWKFTPATLLSQPVAVVQEVRLLKR